MVSPKLNYTQVKFGVNPLISFEVIGKNKFVRMIQMKRIWIWIILINVTISSSSK